MATHCSVHAWRIPDRGAGKATVRGHKESDTTSRLTLSLSHMVGDEEYLIVIVFF